MPPRWRRRLKHLSIASGIALSLVEVDARDVQGHVQVAVVVAVVVAVMVAVIQHALVIAEEHVMVHVEIFVFMVTHIDNQLL